MDKILQDKYERLKSLLKEFGRVLVAFSGGLDSAFLLKTALEVLDRNNVLAVTAFSDSLSPQELKEAIRIASELNVQHRIILTEEFLNPEYLKNSPNRCYLCKDELFLKLKKIADFEGIQHIAYGAIADDEGDFRPGMLAAKQHKIDSPLQTARLTKAEIRVLARDLPFWDKPAAPCLSSRIQYGEEITPEKLRQVDQAERILKELGLSLVRVRHHDRVARIEVGTVEIPLLIDPIRREQIVARLKELGYIYITIDLEGYRQGSLNLAAKS